MLYDYKCSNCSYKEQIDIPLGTNLKEPYDCPNCKKGKCKHDFFGQIKSQSVQVPQHMMATSRYTPRIKYKKDAAIEKAEAQ